MSDQPVMVYEEVRCGKLRAGQRITGWRKAPTAPQPADDTRGARVGEMRSGDRLDGTRPQAELQKGAE